MFTTVPRVKSAKIPKGYKKVRIPIKKCVLVGGKRVSKIIDKESKKPSTKN